VVALLLLAAIVHMISRIIDRVLGLPGALRGGSERARAKRGEMAVTQTLVALAAQDAKAAAKWAMKAQKYLGHTPQTLLLKASASGIAQDHEGEKAAFEALAKHPEGGFLGLRGLLNMAVKQGDLDRAASLAKAAHEVHPAAGWLRHERADLAARIGAWRDALELSGDALAQAGFGAQAAEHETHAPTARKLARAAHKKAPGLAAAALVYARLLREEGRENASLDVLRRCWGIMPNPQLAQAALAGVDDKLARLKRGNALVRDAKTHPESQYLLARLSLDAGAVSEAQRLAEAARAGGITERRMYALLADIASALGNSVLANDVRARMESADDDPAWHCNSCHTNLNEWAPACPHCNAHGTVSWGKANALSQAA